MNNSLTFTPSAPVSLGKKVRLYGTMGLVAAAALALSITAATSQSTYGVIGIQVVPPTVSGIPEAPSAARYYVPQDPQVFPSAKIYHLGGEAGPNGCGPHQFEVLNRIRNEQRCVGR